MLVSIVLTTYIYKTCDCALSRGSMPIQSVA